MNFYFLLEDSKSALKVFPSWFSYKIPMLTRVQNVTELAGKHYVMESGMGYPQIKNRIHGAIETINAYPEIVIDCFIAILDADDRNVDEVESEIVQEIAQAGGIHCPYKVIVMKKCFETWLLGNCDYYPESISPQFEPFADHFNVSILDPELMEKPTSYCNSTACYHLKYLAEMLRRPWNEKGFNFGKSQPGKACNEEYLDGLLCRMRQTEHIRSFKNFIDTLCRLTNTYNNF